MHPRVLYTFTDLRPMLERGVQLMGAVATVGQERRSTVESRVRESSGREKSGTVVLRPAKQHY